MRNFTFAAIFIALFITTAGAQSGAPRLIINDFRFINDRFEVAYAFESARPTERYMVWLEIRKSSGELISPKELEGDVDHVSPVGEHLLIWNSTQEGVFLDESVSVRLYAMPRSNTNFGKALAYSTAFPGLGYKHVGVNNKMFLGVIGYSGIAGSVVFNSMAAGRLDKYRSEPDPAQSQQFYDDAKAFRTYSLTSLGIGATAWVVNYIILAKNGKPATVTVPSQIITAPDPGSQLLITESERRNISTRGLPPRLNASLLFSDGNGNGILEAGEKAEVVLIISNLGQGSAYDVRVNLSNLVSDENLILGDEVVIPFIKPNEGRRVVIPVSAGNGISTGLHQLKVQVNERFGNNLGPASLYLQTIEKQNPALKIAGAKALFPDPGLLTETGKTTINAGERIGIKLIVQNQGLGMSNNTNYRISTTDGNISLMNNQGSLGAVYPSEVREIYFTLSSSRPLSLSAPLLINIDMMAEADNSSLVSSEVMIRLNQAMPQPQILEMNTGFELFLMNTARFEYSGTDYTIDPGQVFNIRVVEKSRQKASDAVAVIFGISRYRGAVRSPFSVNDAELMKEYFEKVLGINKVLIFTDDQADFARFNSIFNPLLGDLKQSVTKGRTDIFVYYSGLGILGNDGTAYLLPTDYNQVNPEERAVSIENLCEKLNEFEARSVTLILETCFTGQPQRTERNEGKSVLLQNHLPPSFGKPWLSYPNFTLMSSTSGTTPALAFSPMQTGLFTYFLASGLQGKADRNKDGRTGYLELQRYITDNLTRESRKIVGLQIPEFYGDNNRIIVQY